MVFCRVISFLHSQCAGCAFFFHPHPLTQLQQLGIAKGAKSLLHILAFCCKTHQQLKTSQPDRTAVLLRHLRPVDRRLPAQHILFPDLFVRSCPAIFWEIMRSAWQLKPSRAAAAWRRERSSWQVVVQHNWQQSGASCAFQVTCSMRSVCSLFQWWNLLGQYLGISCLLSHPFFFFFIVFGPGLDQNSSRLCSLSVPEVFAEPASVPTWLDPSRIAILLDPRFSFACPKCQQSQEYGHYRRCSWTWSVQSGVWGGKPSGKC